MFLPPLGFGPEGPIYASRILWYRPFVPPVAAAVLAYLVYVAWRHRVGRLIKDLMVRRRFPWGALAILLAVALASTLAEGHLRPFAAFSFKQGESFEELVELVGYLALLAAQQAVLREMGTASRAALAPARTAVSRSASRAVDHAPDVPLS